MVPNLTQTPNLFKLLHAHAMDPVPWSALTHAAAWSLPVSGNSFKGVGGDRWDI